MAKRLNLHDTKKVIDTLKSMDLETASIDEIKEQLFLIKHHVATKRILYKNTVVCRTVEKYAADDIYTSEVRISYKKETKGMGFGRASYEGQTAFYGCLNTKIVDSPSTSALEILPFAPNEIISKYDVVMGKWILEADTELIFLGGSDNLLHLCDEGIERHNFLFESIRNDHENIIILKLIDSFICSEFSKKVDPERPWEYKISACYSEMLKENGEPGLIYPSVAVNGAGLNIVFFPDFVDRGLIRLEAASFGTFYNRYGTYVNEYTMQADNDNGILRWKEIFGHSLPNPIKRYYLGLTDIDPLRGNVPYVDLGAKRIT